MTPPARRLAAMTLLAASVARAAEPASPADVYRDYAAAMASADIAKAATLAVADDKRQPLLAARPAAAAAERRLRAAIDKAFPGQFREVPYGGPTSRPQEVQPSSRTVVRGDTATMIVRDSIEAVRFRRIKGEWKVDLDAMYSQATVSEIERFRGAMVEVMNAVAVEIDAGRFKTLAAAEAELATRVKMRLATPDLPATTRPAF